MEKESKTIVSARVTTTTKQDTIIQTVEFLCNDAVINISRTVTSTKDEQIREALIKLGWTPPGE
jgi:predicted site-specific integrase-resolvase